MRERTDQERARYYQGIIGERLVYRNMRFRTLVPRGCKVIRGHKPEFEFANLPNVMHLDWLAVDSNSNIRLICEVKTTVTRRNAFGLNGVSPDVLNRAQARAIPLHLAVVRLKQKPPESISTVDGARAYEAWLRDHPNEFSVEIYDESQFTIRGMGISLVS